MTEPNRIRQLPQIVPLDEGKVQELLLEGRKLRQALEPIVANMQTPNEEQLKARAK